MFPIKYIDNNLVWNKDNEVFAYYELIPYNYSFLSAEQNLSIPYRTRAGILPLIPRNSRKRAYWRAVRQAALSLTRFLEAAPPGLQRKALTAAISALN